MVHVYIAVTVQKQVIYYNPLIFVVTSSGQSSYDRGKRGSQVTQKELQSRYK